MYALGQVLFAGVAAKSTGQSTTKAGKRVLLYRGCVGTPTATHATARV